jgi:hypothetical protein
MGNILPNRSPRSLSKKQIQLQQDVIGKTEEIANAMALKRGFIVRETVANGVGHLITLELKENRLNVETTDGIISKLRGWG